MTTFYMNIFIKLVHIKNGGIYMFNNDVLVLIKYSNENRNTFQFYSEFLKFIGYIVCEYLKEDKDSKKLDEYSFSFELDLDFDDKSQIDLEISTYFQGSEAELNALKETFQEYNLFQASVTLQCFSSNALLVTKAGDLFKSAVKKLNSFLCNYKLQGSFEFLYAIFYCKQKVNLSCYFCDKKLFYPTHDLANELLITLSNSYSEKNIISVLLGEMFEIDPINRGVGSKQYFIATEHIGSEPYNHILLYKIANFYNVPFKNTMLDTSYYLMPTYWNSYSIALQYIELEAYDDALDYLQECIEKLKIRGNYMSPLEQKYLFNAYTNLAFVNIKCSDNYSAWDCIRGASIIKNNLIKTKNNMKGYNKFYDIYQNCDYFSVIEAINAELEMLLNSRSFNQYRDYLSGILFKI